MLLLITGAWRDKMVEEWADVEYISVYPDTSQMHQEHTFRHRRSEEHQLKGVRNP